MHIEHAQTQKKKKKMTQREKILLWVLLAGSVWAVERLSQSVIEAYVEFANGMGFLAQQEGVESEAEDWLKSAIAKARWLRPRDHRLARSLSNIGIAYGKQKKHAEALAAFDEAREIMEKTMPPADPYTGNVWYNLGRCYENQQRFVEAERYLRKSLPNLMRGGLEIGMALPDAKLHLGFSLEALGRSDEADAFVREGMADHDRLYGANSPQTGNALRGAGEFHLRRGRGDEAETNFRRALVIFKQSHGSDNPEVGKTLKRFAVVLAARGKNAEAEAARNEADHIFERMPATPEAERATAMLNLAFELNARDQSDAAEEMVRKAQAVYEKEAGPESYLTGMTHAALGVIYCDRRAFADAEQHTRRALAIFQKDSVRNDREIAATKSNLALLRFYRGDYAGAEALALEAQPLLEKHFGAESLENSTVLNRLGLARRGLKKYAEAEAALKQALTIRDKLLPADHEWLVISLENLASVYEAQGKRARARELEKRIQSIGRRQRLKPILQ